MNNAIPQGWRFEECNEDGIFNCSYMVTAPDPRWPDDEEERIVICRFPTGTGKFGPHYHNAKLIAAAPELLEACKALLAMVDEMLPKAGPCGWGTIETDAARALIAKATE